MSRVRTTVFAGVILGVPLMVSAQLVPLGSDLQVNTFTTGDQRIPAVCRGANGGFVAVWQDNNGHDGDFEGVFAQRFSQNGSKLGTEFQVNSYTTNDQSDPAVCCDTAGNFVAVWESYSQDGDSFGVFGQRLASSGAQVGNEFEVNTFNTGFQGRPSVTCDAAGNFVVVWESGQQDGNYFGVFSQRFASTGAKLGTEFQVNTYTTNSQGMPDVASDASGRFVVVWTSGPYYGLGQDGDREGVFGQRFTSTGGKLGTEFQVNSYTTVNQNYPALCSDPAGNFVVAWQSGLYYTGGTQDGQGFGIFGQRFGSSGGRLGGEFQINTFTSSNQITPDVACDPSGQFLVVWASESQDGNHRAVIAREFSASGIPQSSELQINTYTTGDQQYPMVASGNDGSFVIVWESTPSRAKIPQQGGGIPQVGAAGPNIPSQDGDDAGIFARGVAPVAKQVPTLSHVGLAIAVLALLVSGCVTLLVRRRRSVEERS